MSALVRIVLGLLPSLAWLFFYLEEDHPKHDEAKKLLFATFLLGGIATFLVLPVQLFLNRRLPGLGIYGNDFFSFFVLGGIEELFKFAVVFIFLRRQQNFTAEPIHVMIYMITAALGFAAVENVASAFRVGGVYGLSSAVFETVTLRFIGATLLHTLSSGLLGYYWAEALVRKRYFWFSIAGGLAASTLLHAVFNKLIISTGPATYAIVFLVFAAFFVLNDFEKLKQEHL